MQPRSYLIFKWIVYSLATFLLIALQNLILNQVRVEGLIPFLYPMLPALVAMYEGKRGGLVFALVFGTLCGLLLPAPFPGFFAILFPILALIAVWITKHILSPGFFCGLLVSALALILTGAFRVLVQVLSGGVYLELMVRIAAGEVLLTLPAFLAAFPVYRAVHRRCSAEY